MIYGYVNLRGIRSRPESTLHSIGRILKWEGCIEEFVSRNEFKGIWLSNKKKIVDKENVFFENRDNTLIVFLDGLVYNSKQLSKQLSYTSPIIKTPELIYEAYLKWGEAFAEHLNGDFAVCIYDKDKDLVLFFVDHLGIRPLAISIVDTTIYFATDVMGFSKGLCNNQKIDPNYLLNIFLKAGHDFIMTPHRSIVRIKPGHYFRFSIKHHEMKRYWFPERIREETTLTEKQIISDLKWLLTDAVKIRADQRYKASAHVSGGLDSSIVAAYARKAYSNQETFYGFSWSPEPANKIETKKNDERLRVVEICSQNNMIPFFSNYNINDFIAYVSDWRHPSELIWENKILAAAKEKGIDLIFSGWGGDEFISIANRGIDADMLRNFNWKHFLKKFPVWNYTRFTSAIRKKISFFFIRSRYSKYKADPFVYRYLSRTMKSNTIPLRNRFHHHSRKAVHLQLINMNHIAARTGDWYVNGQINGVEYRYPLLDIRIVEYMLKVPSKFLVDGDTERLIFRMLGKGLITDDILTRLSKSDPANTNALSIVTNEATEQFVAEFKNFKENPGLSFLNFKKLEKDMVKLSVLTQKNKAISTVFYYLKKAHEFTKGYYS